MAKWDFREVKTANGKTELVEPSPERRERIPRYVEALETALTSQVADPRFSNYYVLESLGTHEHPPVPGGNIEYGFCQALHAEEAAVAALRARYGRFDWTERRDKLGRRRIRTNEDMVLGIIAGVPGLIASPCGNCRDIMMSDLGWEFEIVSGAKDGGIAVVAKMRDYLMEDYEVVPLDGMGRRELRYWRNAVAETLEEGETLENNAYLPADYHRPGRVYYAVIETKRANYFGAHDVMCEYHPIYALRDAVRQARRANDPFVRSVLIVADAGNLGSIGGTFPPQVMYKDRQHLAELNVQAELLSGKEPDPTVFLATYDGELYRRLKKVAVKKLWATSVKEWLPFAFTPKNFGPEFVEHLTAYYKSKAP
ncbi:MAG: hypothetical protein Q8Q41_03015 [bacterium]|nr:hypothetical protein [bacterium]